MPKINKIKQEGVWGYNQLFPILQDAFHVLYISYQNIFQEKLKSPYIYKKRMPLEDMITDDLVEGTRNIEKLLEYRIQKQQQDFKTNSKIDIAILYSLKFGDNSDDLKIECKRLDNIDYIEFV